MHPNKIHAWRNVASATYSVRLPEGGVDALDAFISVLHRVLAPCPPFGDFFKRLISLCAQKGNLYAHEREITHSEFRCAEVQDPKTASFCPQYAITLRLRVHEEPQHVRMSWIFTDERRGTKVHEAIMSCQSPSLALEQLTYGNSLFFNSNVTQVGELWSSCSEILDDRLRHSFAGERMVSRLLPRDGEQVIVYRTEAAGELDLPVNDGMPTHHNPRVFASIGPHTLAFLPDHPKLGRVARHLFVITP